MTTSSRASTAPYSNASSTKNSAKKSNAFSSFDKLSAFTNSENGGFSDAAVAACYLKTKSSKFKKFQLAIVQEQLNFYKHESTEESMFNEKPKAVHGLSDVHVTCGAIEQC
jgi:hypothetical protein